MEIDNLCQKLIMLSFESLLWMSRDARQKHVIVKHSVSIYHYISLSCPPQKPDKNNSFQSHFCFQHSQFFPILFVRICVRDC